VTACGNELGGGGARDVNVLRQWQAKGKCECSETVAG